MLHTKVSNSSVERINLETRERWILGQYGLRKQGVEFVMLKVNVNDQIKMSHLLALDYTVYGL